MLNWDQGLRRLALGGFMTGDASGERRPFELGADAYVPQELAPSDLRDAAAFGALVRSLLGKPEAELAVWRTALREALGSNGRLITDVVAELRLIIGEQPPVPGLPAEQSQRRFQLVFRQFVNVFARRKHPLVLFVDDLQWIDPGTLDVVEGLLTQGDVQQLLVIGAYRDNEVDTNHPLMRRIDAIRRAGTPVQAISLPPHLCRSVKWSARAISWP